MPKEKGLLTVYKRGQGLWARVTFAVVFAVFLIWFLVSLNGSFKREVILLEGSYTLLDSDGSTLSLNEGHLDRLEEYGVPDVAVRIREKDEEELPLEDLKTDFNVAIGDVRKALEEGKTVYLYDDIIIDRPVTAGDIELFRKYKTLDEKISVVIPGAGEGTVLRDWAAIKQEIDAGNRVYLKGDVFRRSWWHGRLVTVPAVEVDINNGNIIVIVLLLLGALGIFRLVNSTRNADFLIETESELKKVDWSSREEVFGSTKVVIVITLVFLVFMFILDTIYRAAINTIKNVFIPGA